MLLEKFVRRTDDGRNLSARPRPVGWREAPLGYRSFAGTPFPPLLPLGQNHLVFPAVILIVLLIASNVFMTFAWYDRL